MMEIPITQARKSLFFMSSFGSATPFMLLAKLKVKEDKVAEYLEIADKKDKETIISIKFFIINFFVLNYIINKAY